MEIILLDKVANVGVLGDKVTVKSGYARNYLIPQGKAVFASAENIAVFEQRRMELEKKSAETLATAEERKTALDALGEVVVTHKVGSEGKLFGSVGTADIAAACAAQGVEISKSEVRLPADGAFRLVGDYEVGIHLHTDVITQLAIKVVGE